MEKENKHGKMAATTRDSIKMGLKMAMEYTTCQLEMFIKGSGIEIRYMERVS